MVRPGVSRCGLRETHLFWSVEGRYQTRWYSGQLNPVQVDYPPPQNMEVLYRTRELWNKLPESQISKHVCLPCVPFTNSQPVPCICLVVLLLLGTFWNSRWVWELHYEWVYFKNKLIISFFSPSAFYSGVSRYYPFCGLFYKHMF